MTRRLARPYAVVGGRTTPALPDLRVEAQVVRTPAGLRSLPDAVFERREILLLCAEPVSVAELAARRLGGGAQRPHGPGCAAGRRE